MSYFVPLGNIAVAGIQVEKNLEVIRMKNIEVFQKGCDLRGVIKGMWYRGCDKGHEHVFILGMQKPYIL